MRILMVCLGNICRSPIAEGVLRHKIKEKGLNWTVESAGTEHYHIGEPPHQFSQKVCLAHGIDISDLRAAKFTGDDFDHYDIIYAMAEDVYLEIEQIGDKGADMHKVRYFLNELYENSNQSVPDPYGHPEKEFTLVYNMINETCDAIIAHYNK